MLLLLVFSILPMITICYEDYDYDYNYDDYDYDYSGLFLTNVPDLTFISN